MVRHVLNMHENKVRLMQKLCCKVWLTSFWKLKKLLSGGLGQKPDLKMMARGNGRCSCPELWRKFAIIEVALAFYCTLWRVGEHQFSSAKCPRSFHCGEHFPSSPFSQATIAIRKKKAIVVKRFSISRQLARATTVSIHMHATY